ncbi:MAG: SPOR domain-containing protein [Pseudomonadota bacterium]
MFARRIASPLVLALALAASTLPERGAAEPSELSLYPDGYTVQLIALPTAERLTTFVRERGVPNLIAAEVRRDGEPHYVLLFGAFADRASAVRAAEQLPEALSDLTPWIRPMSSLLAAVRAP